MTATVATWQTLATERDLQETLRVAALRAGWLYMHVHDSRRSPAGFPDLIAIRQGRMLALEIKQQRGRVAEHQRAWIARFAEIPNCVAAIVRPVPKPGEISFDRALELLAGEPR